MSGFRDLFPEKILELSSSSKTGFEIVLISCDKNLIDKANDIHWIVYQGEDKTLNSILSYILTNL